MIDEDMKDHMADRLQKLDIPRESIEVFGRARVNIHVKCIGKETSNLWRAALSSFSEYVKVVPTQWDAKINKNTATRPTQRHGYLIAAII